MNQLDPSASLVSNAKVVYILYPVSILVGVTSLIGVIMGLDHRFAHNRAKMTAWAWWTEL
jgi:uncharacterized membrane protein